MYISRWSLILDIELLPGLLDEKDAHTHPLAIATRIALYAVPFLWILDTYTGVQM